MMQNEELKNIFSRIHACEALIPLKDICCGHGIIYELFISKSPIFYKEYLPLINDIYKLPLFRDDFMSIRRIRLKNEKIHYEKRLASCVNDTVSKGHIENIERELAIQSFEKLLEFFICQYKSFYKEMNIIEYKILWETVNGFEDIEQNFIFYEIAVELYNYYTRILKEDREIANDNSFIIDYFRRQDVDISNINSFSKYGLIQYDNSLFKINNYKDSRTLVYLKDPESHQLWITTNKHVTSEIKSLFDAGKIGSLGFKITDITKCIPLMEERERGYVFQLNIDELPEITSLYDYEHYDNKLQIKFNKDKLSLTFEELDEDVKFVSDYIRTQVIHMQFTRRGGEYLINHMDHEYIYYTFEKYEERKIDTSVHGEKIKTFKIDNAQIPLTYKVNNVFFIYFMLDNYFSHKKLLEEYFHGLINAS